MFLHTPRERISSRWDYISMECISDSQLCTGVSRPTIKKFALEKYNIKLTALAYFQLNCTLASGIKEGSSGKVKLAPKNKPNSAKEISAPVRKAAVPIKKATTFTKKDTPAAKKTAAALKKSTTKMTAKATTTKSSPKKSSASKKNVKVSLKTVTPKTATLKPTTVVITLNKP
ncbi:hypothetical protein C8Q75DRAFT_729051 [Abortiporus biennis]|nr:hypothetical protein C8Q75DRAFT_729051 [Abortiporus biennis]